jgi:hypothetical protein
VGINLFAANAVIRLEARLFVRGFAAHQIAVAAVALAGLSRSSLRRPAMLLAATIDAADITAAVLEARARGRLDPDLTGGIAFSAVGFVSLWSPSQRSKGPDEPAWRVRPDMPD